MSTANADVTICRRVFRLACMTILLPIALPAGAAPTGDMSDAGALEGLDMQERSCQSVSGPASQWLCLARSQVSFTLSLPLVVYANLRRKCPAAGNPKKTLAWAGNFLKNFHFLRILPLTCQAKAHIVPRWLSWGRNPPWSCNGVFKSLMQSVWCAFRLDWSE
jgi:hypothetical protein